MGTLKVAVTTLLKVEKSMESTKRTIKNEHELMQVYYFQIITCLILWVLQFLPKQNRAMT